MIRKYLFEELEELIEAEITRFNLAVTAAKAFGFGRDSLRGIERMHHAAIGIIFSFSGWSMDEYRAELRRRTWRPDHN